MLYRLRLSIRYDFARPTGAGRQLLRITPADLPGWQEVQQTAITITPQPIERGSFVDFFGNEVTELVLPAGLTQLRFDMTGRVLRHRDETELDLSATPADLSLDLDEITDLGPHSPHHFLRPSPRIPQVASITDFARAACADAATVREAVEALGRAIHAHMRFDADATEVDTPIAQAFAGQKGVCQDFSQIMISGLRGLGIPGAYVSGFLRTIPPPGKPRLEGGGCHARLGPRLDRGRGGMVRIRSHQCPLRGRRSCDHRLWPRLWRRGAGHGVDAAGRIAVGQPQRRHPSRGLGPIVQHRRTLKPALLV